MNAIEHAAQLIRAASSGIAFTGAGISTESGIPDFRSPTGIWQREKPVMYNDFMSSRDERVRYWKMRQVIYQDTINAKPNKGHLVLAELQRRGHLCGVITQNIDGLHQDAGSTQVIELHGTNRIIACQTCGKESLPSEILPRLEAGEEAPECDECGGPLKSKTISFGQAMPAEEMHSAFELTKSADVYLALGSSLVVQPAATFPQFAKQNGTPLVIINREETPLDGLADVVIRDDIGVTMESVLSELDSAS